MADDGKSPVQLNDHYGDVRLRSLRYSTRCVRLGNISHHAVSNSNSERHSLLPSFPLSLFFDTIVRVPNRSLLFIGLCNKWIVQYYLPPLQGSKPPPSFDPTDWTPAQQCRISGLFHHFPIIIRSNLIFFSWPISQVFCYASRIRLAYVIEFLGFRHWTSTYNRADMPNFVRMNHSY